MLGQVSNVAPVVELHWRIVGKRRKSFVATRNGFILNIVPSGIPFPDGFMRGKVRKNPLRAEHKSHVSAVDSHLFLCILHAVEELKEPDIWPNSEIMFAQHGEVGEKKIRARADIMGLQPIGVEHLQEKL
jgi:hypothetical protein